uniref:Uncharacterized protein n=1 Tax=Glossina morsitans morsitans TaxID=37546 RepID=A0A1B0FL89_GLOMM
MVCSQIRLLSTYCHELEATAKGIIVDVDITKFTLFDVVGTEHGTKLHGDIISPLPSNQLMDTRTHTIFIQYDDFYITGMGVGVRMRVCVLMRESVLPPL